MSNQDQGQKGLGEGPIDARNITRTLWQTLERDGRFTRLLEAARNAHLEQELNSEHRLTVFAVTDETLESAQDQNIETVIGQQVVRGYQTSADLGIASELRTHDGAPLPVSGERGETVLGGARIVHGDIACTNGMIHIVDRLVSTDAHSEGV